jgi:PAS domain S-box-containing protein
MDTYAPQPAAAQLGSGALLSINDAEAAQAQVRAQDAERTRLLYEGSVPNLLQFLGVGYITGLLLLREVGGNAVLAWVAALTLAFSVRLMVSQAYDRATVQSRADHAIAWENRYAWGAFAAGAAWASLYLYLAIIDFPLSALMVMAVTLITAGILLTAIAALGPSARAYVALAVPMLGAQLATLLFVRHYSVWLALGLAVLYGVGVARVYVAFQRSLKRHIAESIAFRQASADQEALFSSTLVGIVHVKNRFILRANKQFFSMLRYSPDQLLGQSFHKLFAFDSHKRTHDAIIADALESGASFTHEEGLRRQDGLLIWCTLQGRRYDANDPRGGMILVIVDVTQMKDAQEALKQREAIYRTLVETTPSLIWSLDLNGNVTFANERGAVAMFGMTAQDMLGKNWSELLVQRNHERDWNALKLFLHGKSIIDHETTALKADGTEVEVLINGTTLRGRDGRVTGATGSLIDITARRQREDALKHTNQGLTSAREALLTAIDAMPDGFALWDKDDRLEVCNRKFAEQFGPDGNPLRVIGFTYEELMRRLKPDDLSMPLGKDESYESHIAEMVARHQLANSVPRLSHGVDGTVTRIIERRLPDGGIIAIGSDVTAFYQQAAPNVTVIGKASRGGSSAA